MKILEVQHVVKTYGSHQNQVKALSDVSFAAEKNRRFSEEEISDLYFRITA